MGEYKISHDNTLKSFLKVGFREFTKNDPDYPSVATPYNSHFNFYKKELTDGWKMYLLVDKETKDAIFRISYSNNSAGWVEKQVRFKIEL